jgi:hypothetical protein
MMGMVKMDGGVWLVGWICIFRWPGFGGAWRWHSPQLRLYHIPDTVCKTTGGAFAGITKPTITSKDLVGSAQSCHA